MPLTWYDNLSGQLHALGFKGSPLASVVFCIFVMREYRACCSSSEQYCPVLDVNLFDVQNRYWVHLPIVYGIHARYFYFRLKSLANSDCFGCSGSGTISGSLSGCSDCSTSCLWISPACNACCCVNAVVSAVCCSCAVCNAAVSCSICLSFADSCASLTVSCSLSASIVCCKALVSSCGLFDKSACKSSLPNNFNPSEEVASP